MARTIEEIQQEYNVKCAELGQATYRVRALELEIRATEKDIEKAIKRLKLLNLEAAQVQGKEVPKEQLEEANNESAS
jgi:hypothetical protein